MKKFALAFSVLILILTSCSSSDEEPTPTPEVTGNKLIKEIATKNGVSTTTNYTYNGDKLVSAITVGGDKQYITYTGDYITKIEYFSNDDVIDTRFEYSYVDGKNTEEIFTGFIDGVVDFKDKYTFTHLSNGNVDYSISEYNLTTGVLKPAFQTGTYAYLNDNCISVTSINNDPFTSANTTITKVFTYDDKNNYNRNILNLKKLVSDDHFTSKNNALSFVSTKVVTVGGFSDTTTTSGSFVRTYNANNYVATETRSEPNRPTIYFENFYN